MNTKKVWIVQLRVTDDGMNDKDISEFFSRQEIINLFIRNDYGTSGIMVEIDSCKELA